MSRDNLETMSKIELIKIIESQDKKLNALEKENELWHELQIKNKQVKGLLTDIDKTEKKYLDVLLNFPLPIFIYKKTGEINFANKQAENFTGFNLEEVKNIESMFNQLYPDTIHRENVRRIWRDEIEKFENNKISLIHITNTIRSKSKKSKYVSFYAVEFQNDLLVVMVDLSAQKKMEDKLVEAREKADKANRAKTKFFANMTHEIKTPMNAILGFSQILEQSLSDDRDLYYASSIKQAGNNLIKLIDNLLDFAKLDSDNLPLNYGKTYLVEIINEMKAMFSLKLREKNINFIVKTDMNLPDVFILDEARIKQVLFNIINNSMQMTNKGHVEVKLEGKVQENQNTDLKITISDTGSGVSDFELKAMFNPFNGNNKALGLGLAERLVSKMNGKLVAKSKKGEGTTFIIELPNIKYTTEVRQRVDFVTESIDFKNESILVIDDTQLNIEVVTNLLINEKLKVYTAKSGLEGLEILVKNNIAMIFLDLKMPGLNGYETLDRIKKLGKKVKVVALTASSESGAKILAYGFDGIIKKPFVRKELIDQLITQLYGQVKLSKHSDDDDELELSDELLLSKEEIIFFLETELKSAWEAAIEYEDIDEIKEFANRVRNYAKKINFTSLIDYADELRMNLRTFNIKGIRVNLNNFGSFIENFKKS